MDLLSYRKDNAKQINGYVSSWVQEIKTECAIIKQ